MRKFGADLIEVFKIMEGLEGLKKEDFYIMNQETFRNNTLKIYKDHDWKWESTGFLTE